MPLEEELVAIKWAPWIVSESATVAKEPSAVVTVRFADYAEPDSPFCGKETKLYFVSALNDGTVPATVFIRSLDDRLLVELIVAPGNEECI